MISGTDLKADNRQGKAIFNEVILTGREIRFNTE